MAERHKWADVIIAWANGERIERRYKASDTASWVSASWLNAEFGNPDYEWRIKPRTIAIGGVEVPQPLREAPELETVLYIPRPDDDDLVYEFFFRGLEHQTGRIEKSLCHLSAEAAIAHAKALIAISGGTV